MKNLFVWLIAVFCLSAMTSCASTPFKKRKGCKGNGGWYGKRNLGVNHQQKANENIYVSAPAMAAEASF